MGRSKRPPPLLYDDEPKKPEVKKEEPKKKPINNEKVIGTKVPKAKAAPMTAKEAVKKLTEPNPIIKDKPYGGPKAPEGLPPLPIQPPRFQADQVVKYAGGKMVILYTKRVYVVHDQVEGTVTITEVKTS